jgi:hypothetical protein
MRVMRAAQVHGTNAEAGLDGTAGHVLFGLAEAPLDGALLNTRLHAWELCLKSRFCARFITFFMLYTINFRLNFDF